VNYSARPPFFTQNSKDERRLVLLSYIEGFFVIHCTLSVCSDVTRLGAPPNAPLTQNYHHLFGYISKINEYLFSALETPFTYQQENMENQSNKNNNNNNNNS